MQTTLSGFLESTAHPQTLPFAEERQNANTTKKRTRDTDYKVDYPVRSTVSRSVSTNLRLLDCRLYSGHHVRSQYAPRSSQRSSLATSSSPAVCQLSPPLHLHRSNDDGEALISSVDTFKNCITDIEWDPKDDFFISTSRSRFQLFGVSSFPNDDTEQTDRIAPLLELKASSVQTRLGAENRISFGLSTVRFLGSTLNTICCYNGTAQIDVFDLEDLDEDTGEPLRSFDMASIFSSQEQSGTNGIPNATAVVAISDSLAIAALSNGCTAYIDTRVAKPIMCTRSTAQSEIINSYRSYPGRAQRRRCNTALDIVNSGCDRRLVTGTKNGLVELWDLRKCDQTAFSTSVGGAVETLKSVRMHNSVRCGAPTVWLNTDSGDVSCLSIGATSFETVSSVKTDDTRRSHSSANLAPPKLSVTAENRALVYPHISSNTVLLYDFDDNNTEKNTSVGKSSRILSTQREELKVNTSSARSDFRNAHSLLLEQESALFGDPSSLSQQAPETPSPSLLLSLPFRQWSSQISSVSAAKRHDAIIVGGDDGDLHLVFSSEA